MPIQIQTPMSQLQLHDYVETTRPMLSPEDRKDADEQIVSYVAQTIQEQVYRDMPQLEGRQLDIHIHRGTVFRASCSVDAFVQVPESPLVQFTVETPRSDVFSYNG